MPGYLLNQGFPLAFCAHGSSQVGMITPNYTVKILGQPVATFNEHETKIVKRSWSVTS